MNISKLTSFYDGRHSRNINFYLLFLFNKFLLSMKFFIYSFSFLVCFIGCRAVERNYVHDVAPDFYRKCPCLTPMPGTNPLRKNRTATVGECWGLCFFDDNCFSFSFSVKTVIFFTSTQMGKNAFLGKVPQD